MCENAYKLCDVEGSFEKYSEKAMLSLMSRFWQTGQVMVGGVAVWWAVYNRAFGGSVYDGVWESCGWRS